MILKIKNYGEECLWTPAQIVTDFTGMKTLISDMTETMIAASGVGLAANQVGRQEAAFVWDYDGAIGHVINPEIKLEGSLFDQIEGCLSCYGEPVKVQRHSFTSLSGKTFDGEEVNVLATGLLSCIFQHEYNHLQGKLLFDLLPRTLRRKYINGKQNIL